MSDHLSLPIRLPDDDADRFDRLATLTQRVANYVLKDHWTPTHLNGIADASHQAWKYFDEHDPFEELDLYLPSRFRRCILQKVGETLRSHADRQDAFQSIQSLLPDHKIRRIHRRHIKDQLWDDGDYLSSGYVDILIDQLNSYYDRHGTYPDTYLGMQDCPEYDSGVLPFSADDGPTSGQAVKYQYDSDNETLTIRLKTPDTLSPETRGDWSWTEYERGGYEAFHDLLAQGDLSAPEFQSSRRKTGDAYYELSFPVEVEQTGARDDIDCVLALDAGMRKDMTGVVVTDGGEQLSTPHFIQFTDRDGMRRLHRERTRLNDRLAALGRDGRSHTDEFAHIQSEYERVNSKLQHKREQLTHDVANQVLALALAYDVDTIVHEDLRSLSPPRDEGALSWELSSWARRDIIENIEYRAESVGVAVERVYPQGTSRSCPRCGATGHTCKSPDHHGELWWGGHFRCDNTRCDFEGDRDYIGALNVARVFFSDGDTLDHGFTSSYMGDSETVLARRSAGTRLTFGSGIVAYNPEQAAATAGGGSAVIAPAVALPESNADGSDGRGPVVQQCTQFLRCTTENY
ncbi:zinc ribbon domain-containing protein [Haloarcula salinisoli]|uniref:Transposase n=1 Tax=Haloarcula salinisoli TaxID=2487746 RepID=A0A8J8C9U6_9EURY|nr:zinc ribbon domain-containing protein [Halomicroarcula salinisoli]MBX0305727.1 transposase [Halomicroarcula salinisoli]